MELPQNVLFLLTVCHLFGQNVHIAEQLVHHDERDEINTLGPVFTFLVFSGCLVVSAIIAQFGIPTRQKRLDEVSP